MKTDEQLEQILRATFATRSATVTGGPAWIDAADTDPGTVEYLDLTPRGHRRHRLAPLAAAAIVAAAVVGLVIGVRVAGEHPAPPATPNSTAPAAVTQRGSCPASLPTSWQKAIASHTTTLASSTYGQVSIVGLTDDGTAVVEYHPPLNTPSGVMTLTFGTLPPGAESIRPLATITGRGDSVGWFHQLGGGTLVVATRFVTGDANSAAPTKITTIDIHTGASTVLMQLRGAHPPRTDNAFLQNGTVYWDEYPADSDREIVHTYDVAAGTRSVAYDGPRADSDMGGSAAGIWWTGSALAPDRPVRLPAPVAEHATTEAARLSLTTDGSSYTWHTDSLVGWWASGHPIVQTRLRNAGVQAVAGPIVAFSPAGKRGKELLDTRTGAVVQLPGGAANLTNVVSAHETLLISEYPHVTEANSATTMIRLDTATLPPLQCR